VAPDITAAFVLYAIAAFTAAYVRYIHNHGSLELTLWIAFSGALFTAGAVLSVIYGQQLTQVFI